MRGRESQVSQPAAAAGFSSSLATVEGADGAGALTQVARAESEIKAALTIAKAMPRDEATAYTKVLKASERPGFAEDAMYSFPRGGQNVEGPSVGLAREIARCWGNIRYGLRVVTEDEERIHIQGYAWDLETNTLVEAEDKFAKLIYRKQGGWVKPDERDLRELMNRRGAICIRNAILQVVPKDVVEDALRKCKETMLKAAKGEIQQDREATLRRLAMAFDKFGVNVPMLETRLGHALALTTDAEIVDLRLIHKALLAGEAKREEFFTVPERPGVATASVNVDDVVKASSQPVAPRASTDDSLKPKTDPPKPIRVPKAKPANGESSPANAGNAPAIATNEASPAPPEATPPSTNSSTPPSPDTPSSKDSASSEHVGKFTGRVQALDYKKVPSHTKGLWKYLLKFMAEDGEFVAYTLSKDTVKLFEEATSEDKVCVVDAEPLRNAEGNLEWRITGFNVE